MFAGIITDVGKARQSGALGGEAPVLVRMQALDPRADVPGAGAGDDRGTCAMLSPDLTSSAVWRRQARSPCANMGLVPLTLFAPGHSRIILLTNSARFKVVGLAPMARPSPARTN